MSVTPAELSLLFPDYARLDMATFDERTFSSVGADISAGAVRPRAGEFLLPVYIIGEISNGGAVDTRAQALLQTPLVDGREIRVIVPFAIPAGQATLHLFTVNVATYLDSQGDGQVVPIPPYVIYPNRSLRFSYSGAGPLTWVNTPPTIGSLRVPTGPRREESRQLSAVNRFREILKLGG